MYLSHRFIPPRNPRRTHQLLAPGDSPRNRLAVSRHCTHPGTARGTHQLYMYTSCCMSLQTLITHLLNNLSRKNESRPNVLIFCLIIMSDIKRDIWYWQCEENAFSMTYKLHVLRMTTNLNWYPLKSSNHEAICLFVELQSCLHFYTGFF